MIVASARDMSLHETACACQWLSRRSPLSTAILFPIKSLNQSPNHSVNLISSLHADQMQGSKRNNPPHPGMRSAEAVSPVGR